MLDHVSVAVSDLLRSIAFYDAALAPLGVVRVWTTSDAAGYGPPGGEDCFAIKAERGARAFGTRTHIAFAARNAAAVERFHLAATAAGASDEGAAEYCDEYGPGYFAAFVRDLDGHRLEAVFHEAAGSEKS